MIKRLPLLALLFAGSCSNTPATIATCLAPATGDIRERLLTHLRQEERNGFNGAVLVGRGDSVLLAEEFGSAARDAGPTAFWVASISKAIAATAVMQLVEKGNLRLDEPIARRFAIGPTAYDSITLHHVLSHRGGLPVAYAADGIANRDSAARAILSLKPVGRVGDFFYSNDAYSLLAILVEIASGQSYEEYVQQHIFEPAGMTGAGFWGAEPSPSPVAPPRRAPTSPAVWSEGRSIGSYGYRGATGIYATPQDLYRFARSFITGRLVNLDQVRLMTSSKNPRLAPTAQSYGYGWAIRLQDGELTEFWHGGNENPLGHNGQLRIRGNDVFVTLSNSGEVDSRSWAARIDDGLKACMP